MAKHPGVFISFEGTEGSGKSTLIASLAAHLKGLGAKVTVTREPGGSSVGEAIREILLHCDMDPWTELLLYEAARAEHLSQTLLPALTKGHFVLCDRFTDSTLAYQSAARGLSWKTVSMLNHTATQGLAPQVTFLLDLPPEAGLARVKDPNRFEAEALNFHRKVRKGFQKAARLEPKRFKVLSVAGKSPDEVLALAVSALQPELKKRNLLIKKGPR